MVKNKRGQFYLISAIVLITVFIGIVAIQNKMRQTDQADISKIKEELDLEKKKLLDYIAYNNLNDTSVKSNLTNFAHSYIDKTTKNKNLFFIFGKNDSVRIVGYYLDDIPISYNYGGNEHQLIDEGIFETNIIPLSSEIKFNISNIEYSFDLNDGENIYYWSRYSYNEEVHIISG